LLKLLLNHDWRTALPEVAHQQLFALWQMYLVIGGMPEIINQYLINKDKIIHAMEQVRIKQVELIQAYHSDIAKHAGKVNAMHISRTWEQAAIQLSRTQDETAQRFRFNEVIPGIDRYQRLAGAIDWLNAANLIIKIPLVNNAELPLKANSKESLFKLMYLDVGLLGTRCELLPNDILQQKQGGFKGYMAENFVAQEFAATDIHNMRQLYSWQDYKAELEFLENTELGIIPIEVKAGVNTKAKSLEKYQQKYQPNKSIVLSANNISHDNDKHIEYYPIYLAGLKPWLRL